MANLSPEATALFTEVEAAVVEEVARVGVQALSRSAIVKRFSGRGSKRSTLYRWIDLIIQSGRPDEIERRIIAKAAEERAARVPDSAPSVAADVDSRLPTITRVEQIATVGTSSVIDQLNHCIAAAHQVMKHARTDDGRVRNSRLLLQSSEHLRRCLETAARITETIMRADKIERYHAVIIEEIAAESPIVAERLLRRIDRVSATFCGE